MWSKAKFCLKIPHLIQRLESNFDLWWPWNFRRATCLYSTLKPTIISNVCQNIDIHDLQSNLKYQDVKGCSRNIKEIVLKKVEENCATVIENFDEQQTKRLKLIELEHSFLFTEGHDIQPTDDVSCKTWLEAMTLSTVEERLQFYLSLKPEEGDREDCLLNKSTSQENMWKNHQLVQAMTYEPPLLIDMSFAEQLSSKQIDATAKQIWEMYKTNRNSSSPFHLMLTGCSSNNPVYRYLQLFHAVDEPHFLMSVTKKDLTDISPASEMVYLSSRAKTDLKHFDPNTLYILGAYSNELGSSKSGTVKFRCVARSQELKIRSLRLPIDQHARWPKAPKNLQLQDIMHVLLAVKNGQTWKEAFDHVIKNGATIPDWIKEGKLDNNIQQPRNLRQGWKPRNKQVVKR